jgi:hypothetical protein
MKTKKFSKKLTLSKKTVSNLDSIEQLTAKGGVITKTCDCNTKEINCTLIVIYCD